MTKKKKKMKKTSLWQQFHLGSSLAVGQERPKEASKE